MSKLIKFYLIIVLLGLGMILSCPASEVFTLDNGSLVTFLDYREAEKALFEDYQYFSNINLLDMKLRLGRDFLANLGEPTMEDFKGFVKGQADDFRATQEEKIVELLNLLVKAEGETCPGFFPEQLVFLKTSGREENQGIYPRGRAIVISQEVLAALESKNPHLKTMGELFHLSYQDWCMVKLCRVILEQKLKSQSQVWEKLFGMFGFQKVIGRVDLDEFYQKYRLVNPEYYGDEYLLRLKYSDNGKPVYLLPVYFAKTLGYAPGEGENYSDYVYSGFAKLDETRQGYQVQSYPTGLPVLSSPYEYPDHTQTTIANTADFSSPVAIVGDNFGLMILRTLLQEKYPEFNLQIKQQPLDRLQKYFLLGK